MLAVSLIFVGITLILNGIYFYIRSNQNEAAEHNLAIIVMNLFTGFIVCLFNLIPILTNTNPEKFVGYMGGLLFGVTNFLIAFDLIYKAHHKTTGLFSFLAFISALILGIYYFIKKEPIKGIAWIVWSFIWLFYFISATITPKFEKANAFMLFIQGIVTTYAFGFLQLLQIIKF